MKNIVILMTLSWCLLSCTKESKVPNDSAKFDFTLHHVDTLSSNTVNKVFFEYSNKEFENLEGRTIEIYYTIQDSVYSKGLETIEETAYGVLTDARLQDTIYIDTFKNKGDKIVTFFIYDEVQIPVATDSVRLKSNTNKYAVKTFIK